MVRASDSILLSMTVCCVLAACADERASVPYVSLSSPTRSFSAEAQLTDAAVDAGSDASVAETAATSCHAIPVRDSVAGDAPSATASDLPADFVISRQAQFWTGTCENPLLTLQFSDGACPHGFGHELSIRFALNALADGQIRLGINEIYAGEDALGIAVSYVRPLPLIPRGRWGSCLAASGQLVFLEAPELTRGAVFQGRYDLELSACDETTATATQTVVGAFAVPLDYGLNELCPDRTF